MDTLPFILIVSLVSFIIGLSKGGMGAVLAVLISPLLTLVMPVSHAISTALPLLVIGDVFALWAFWNKWDWRYIRLLLPTAIVGILIGTYILATLPDDVLRRLLGIFILFFVVYKLLDARIKALQYQPHAWHGYLAGAATGLGSAVANVGAPPFTIYMLLQKVDPVVFVGTTTLFFALINALKVPPLIVAHLLDLNDLVAVAWAVPLIPLGVWVGHKVVNRISRTAFENFMLVVLGFSSLILLVIPA